MPTLAFYLLYTHRVFSLPLPLGIHRTNTNRHTGSVRKKTNHREMTHPCCPSNSPEKAQPAKSCVWWMVWVCGTSIKKEHPQAATSLHKGGVILSPSHPLLLVSCFPTVVQVVLFRPLLFASSPIQI